MIEAELGVAESSTLLRTRRPYPQCHPGPPVRMEGVRRRGRAELGTKMYISGMSEAEDAASPASRCGRPPPHWPKLLTLGARPPRPGQWARPTHCACGLGLYSQCSRREVPLLAPRDTSCFHLPPACLQVSQPGQLHLISRFVFFTKDTHGGGSPALLTKGQCPANVVQAKDRRT